MTDDAVTIKESYCAVNTVWPGIDQ